jgi:hypothetical protein
MEKNMKKQIRMRQRGGGKFMVPGVMVDLRH